MRNKKEELRRVGRATPYRRRERIIKGFANFRRLQILELLARKSELSVEEIADELGMGYMNASDHIRKMAIAGLLLKRRAGRATHHKLTDFAHEVLTFCKKLK